MTHTFMFMLFALVRTGICLTLQLWFSEHMFTIYHSSLEVMLLFGIALKNLIFFWVLDIYSLIFKVCNLLSKLHSTHSVSWPSDLTFMNLSSFHRKRFCLDMKHLAMIRQISAISENHCKKVYEQREIEIILISPQACKQLFLHSPALHT